MDALDKLGPRLRRGVRLSMRCHTPDGPSDVIGLVLGVGPHTLHLEDRYARTFDLVRDQVVTARVVPTIARGRNPQRGQPEVVLPAGATSQAVRLCDLLTDIDFTEVEVPDSGSAAFSDSRAELRGEWMVIWLAAESDLDPLASWGVRRNARNALIVRGS